MLSNVFADFVLMNTSEIKYLCMFGYAFLHANNVFNTDAAQKSFAYKFVHLMMSATGGGIIVPILLNLIPVPIAMDAFPIAILAAFFLHSNFPILREVYKLSSLMKVCVIIMFEIFRASVVCKFTSVAGASIPPSDFAFPLFGPIFCGTIAGCGGAFFPLTKGLDPIANGLPPPMRSAFWGATFFHLSSNLAYKHGGAMVGETGKKAQLIVATGFCCYSLSKAWMTTTKPTNSPPAAVGKKKNY